MKLRLHEPDTVPLETVRSGDLLAFRGRGMWSRAIRFWTTSVFTHVGVAYWLEEGPHRRLYVLEAKEGIGVRLHPLGRLLADASLHVDLYQLQDDAGINRTRLIAAALEHVGAPYASPWQFVRTWGIVCRFVADHLGWPTDTDPERFFCSEYLLHVLRAAGYDRNGHLEPPRTSPGEIALLNCYRRLGRL